MMKSTSICLVLAGCLALSACQPIQDSLVLKEAPAEVLFKVDSPVTLQCAVEGSNKNIKYTWHKNGKPVELKAGHSEQHEGNLILSKPEIHDEAVYQCFAETPYGVASTRPISLKRTYLNAPSVKTEEHDPTEGLPFKLDCKIPEAYPKPTIVWKLQDKADPKKVETLLDRRITLSPEGTLYFSNVTEKDVKPNVKYVCMAQNSDKEVVLAEHILKTLVPNKQATNGELTLQYVSNDIVAKVGDVTMMYCIYGGTPLAFPDWFKNGKIINAKGSDRVTDHNRTSGKRLLIKDTYLEDEATYSCDVDNHVGKKQTHTMKLTVVSAPKLTKKVEREITGKEGQDIVIPFPVTGKPEPKVTLTYNAKPLSGKGSFKDGALTLKSAPKSDAGYYGFKAENEHGIIYHEVLVHVA